MTTTGYKVTNNNSAAVVSPDVTKEGMSALYSPRTITLGNQTEAILRGMARNHTAMMLSAKRHEVSSSLFTQTVANAPKLPTLSPSQVSKPIRINRRKPFHLQPRYAPEVQQANNGEDLLSASPTELKLMYDEATWRMYHLIQTARLEKQAAKGAPLTTTTTTVQSVSDAEEDKYIYDDSYFVDTNMPAVVPPSDLEDEVVEPLEEEGMFELDDF